MSNTPRYSFPYQGLSDAPNGPTLGSALALAVESTVGGIDDRLTDAEADIAAILSTVTSAAVATTEGTATSSFTDLATPGPSVTVATGTRALVIIASGCYNGGGAAIASFEVSGASTVAASDNWSVQNANVPGIRGASVKLVTGLTPGNNTFKMKYRGSGGTGNFFFREIIVIPLP